MGRRRIRFGVGSPGTDTTASPSSSGPRSRNAISSHSPGGVKARSGSRSSAVADYTLQPPCCGCRPQRLVLQGQLADLALGLLERPIIRRPSGRWPLRPWRPWRPCLPAGPAVISPRGQVMRPDLHLAGALLQRFAAQPSQHGVGLLTGRRCWPILARTPRAGPREEGRACTKTTPKSPVRLPVGEPACSRPIGPLGVIGAPRNSHGLPEPRSRESRPATRGPL